MALYEEKYGQAPYVCARGEGAAVRRLIVKNLLVSTTRALEVVLTNEGRDLVGNFFEQLRRHGERGKLRVLPGGKA
jgi:hypothetical protein